MRDSAPRTSAVKGVLRKVLSGHLGMHRVTTVQKALEANKITRGKLDPEKYTKISRKFNMLEHSVTLEDNLGDEDNENTKFENTVIETAFRSIVMLFMYFGIGLVALFFIDGNMNFFEIVYFLVITLTTIGYGDISPSNKYSKVFVCMYTLCGLLMFSTALSGLIRYWSQQQEKRFRQQVLDRMNDEDASDDEDSDMDEGFEEVDENDSEGDEEGKIHVENEEEDCPLPDVEAQKEFDMELEKENRGNSRQISSHSHSFGGNHDIQIVYDMTDAVSRYFIEKLRIPHFAVPIIKDLLKSILHIFLNISFGTFIYYMLQDEDDANFVDCLYLTMTTITTVGYGDVVPSTQAAKYFTVFYACLGTIFTANCILKFNQAINNYHKQHRQDIILRSEFSLKSFFDMDSDGNNEVTKEEFLLYKILHMNLVDSEIVSRIERQFHRWDADGSGTLTPADIEIMSNRMKESHSARPNLLNMSRRSGGNGSATSLDVRSNGLVTRKKQARRRSRYSVKSCAAMRNDGSPNASKIHPDTGTPSIPAGRYPAPEKEGLSSGSIEEKLNSVGEEQEIVKIFDESS